jgi:hypothetical protein
VNSFHIDLENLANPEQNLSILLFLKGRWKEGGRKINKLIPKYVGKSKVPRIIHSQKWQSGKAHMALF